MDRQQPESSDPRPGASGPPREPRAGRQPWRDEPDDVDEEYDEYGEPAPAEVGPTEDEVEAWAERERRRRQAWASGPTDAEKRAWARQVRRRRLARAGAYGPLGPLPFGPPADVGLDPLGARYARETQLALEGLGAWLVAWPFQVMASLVRSGRAWEEQAVRPARRRRVRLYEDEL